MIDIKTKKDLKDFPVLEDGSIYVYVMETADRKIKIGITTNIQQRYQSLCGSNSRGIPIERVFVSQPSFLLSLENIMHEYYARYRIPNTEWFEDKHYLGELTFKNVVIKLLSLFSSADYERCNELRKQVTMDEKEKEKAKVKEK